ncbi:hypothetical protein A2V61_01795 [Candidatus Woesebacteria bacterium RBG_19FT_COMBO_47_8]|uniref:Integral membrane protein n=1 Tax=Candidatus Woesebacteria bacterium RBG_13_46_13 TaxID=1802479 RepID=A0A1F7X733_9BACT|nr:MAG: hypothetical protein A2Y68_01830 [Candidatus Woesebacteria bacterium RBG_13_46_13]OGM17114.1 MAG: hypothetical protein A2V61_01795 [Candidatus Woesebacteria bacterium RBG_19FT_COMBO_47_8]HJX59322.1 hypothetical protein [Patescibacteria group bacterium]
MNHLAIDIGASFGSPFSEITSVGGLVSTIVNLALVVAGLIFLVMFVVGGIGIISGAGSDSPEKAAKGKQAITTAVIGFVVVFAAYWIVKLIEVITGISILG